MKKLSNSEAELKKSIAYKKALIALFNSFRPVLLRKSY